MLVNLDFKLDHLRMRRLVEDAPWCVFVGCGGVTLGTPLSLAPSFLTCPLLCDSCMAHGEQCVLLCPLIVTFLPWIQPTRN